MTTVQKRIEKLKAQLAKLEAAPKLKATGLFSVAIKDNKGNVIHTFKNLPSKKAATLKGWEFYTVLVRKLKQKASFSVEAEFKKQA